TRLGVVTSAYAPLKVRMRRGRDQGDIVFDAILNAPQPYKYDDIPDITVAAEKYSRGQFVAALKKAGLTGKANVIKPGAPAPAGSEEKLGRLDFLSQFEAVRAAHAAIAADGESPPRLGVLVRGYANLAQLVAFTLTSA